MNDNVLPEFFVFGQTVDNSTLFHNIHKLMPAHWLTWDGKCLNIQRYWDWQFNEVEPYHSDEHYLQRFKDIIDETVKMHLMSDVPLGVFLSGGLDSSLIAAIMAQHVSEPIQTFSVGFEQKYYSELNFARTVANHLSSQHHEVIVKPLDFFECLTKLIWHEDEPLKGAQSIALYFVAKLAAEHVKLS
jgi:asparagine synthase (glutamine-hydrolysing)